MNLGYNCLRRFRLYESKWNDKNASRHKHEFTVHMILEITAGDHAVKYVHYFDIMRCKHCNSFQVVQHEGSMCVLLPGFDIEKNKLPVSHAVTSSKLIENFKEMKIIGCTEGAS